MRPTPRRTITASGCTTAVQTKVIDGGGTVDSLGTLEANIDIEEAATQAPNATIVSYEGPNTDQGEYDVFNQIVTDDTAPGVSTSWGTCEPGASPRGSPTRCTCSSPKPPRRDRPWSPRPATTGPRTAYDRARSPDGLAVDSPADDPLVTGAGGTSLFGSRAGRRQRARLERRIGAPAAAGSRSTSSGRRGSPW